MTAWLSNDRVYRYTLSRFVGVIDGTGTVAFIGLNPSTADETTDDPTIRRCIRFARDWGYEQLTMLNLFAYRAIDPSALAGVDDPVGPANDTAIRAVLHAASLVVCAWGNLGHGDRAREVLEMIDRVPKPKLHPACLEVTKLGAPKHPLYVRRSATPIPYPNPWR